jgi:hypothetical protein
MRMHIHMQATQQLAMLLDQDVIDEAVKTAMQRQV